MRTLIHSPLLWRLVGGFAVGTAMTFGLAAQDGAPPSPGAAVEMLS